MGSENVSWPAKHNWRESPPQYPAEIAKTNDAMLATKAGSLSGDFHRQYAKDDPKCIETANYFHQTITEMDDAQKTSTAVAEKLAAKGVDIEPIDNQLTELTDTLKKSRTYVHSFSQDTFQQ